MKLICIECPVGCQLSVDVVNGKVLSVTGNKCPRGLAYAAAEMENPVRFFTFTVLTKGLRLTMLPVRTSAPIPKSKIFEAARVSRAIVVDKPVSCGDVIVKGFLGLSVDLVATRDCTKKIL
jgi:CxxC motif-containing protein